MTEKDNAAVAGRCDMWTLFRIFFKIGLFTLGGGYAMIPIIKADVVDRYHWVSEKDYIDIIAVAQSCPGVFAVNVSIIIGYRLRKMPGAICTSLGAALPAFLIILAIAIFFQQFQNFHPIAAMFAGIRPAVVALIAVPTFQMAKTVGISLSTCWIPLLSALLIWLLGVNPVWIIIAAGLAGWLYGTFLKE